MVLLRQYFVQIIPLPCGLSHKESIYPDSPSSLTWVKITIVSTTQSLETFSLLKWAASGLMLFIGLCITSNMMMKCQYCLLLCVKFCKQLCLSHLIGSLLKYIFSAKMEHFAGLVATVKHNSLHKHVNFIEFYRRVFALVGMTNTNLFTYASQIQD